MAGANNAIDAVRLVNRVVRALERIVVTVGTKKSFTFKAGNRSPLPEVVVPLAGAVALVGKETVNVQNVVLVTGADSRSKTIRFHLTSLDRNR